MTEDSCHGAPGWHYRNRECAMGALIFLKLIFYFQQLNADVIFYVRIILAITDGNFSIGLYTINSWHNTSFN